VQKQRSRSFLSEKKILRRICALKFEGTFYFSLDIHQLCYCYGLQTYFELFTVQIIMHVCRLCNRCLKLYHRRLIEFSPVSTIRVLWNVYFWRDFLINSQKIVFLSSGSSGLHLRKIIYVQRRPWRTPPPPTAAYTLFCGIFAKSKQAHSCSPAYCTVCRPLLHTIPVDVIISHSCKTVSCVLQYIIGYEPMMSIAQKNVLIVRKAASFLSKIIR
jgi:hypothetical protein